MYWYLFLEGIGEKFHEGMLLKKNFAGGSGLSMRGVVRNAYFPPRFSSEKNNMTSTQESIPLSFSIIISTLNQRKSFEIMMVFLNNATIFFLHILFSDFESTKSITQIMRILPWRTRKVIWCLLFDHVVMNVFLHNVVICVKFWQFQVIKQGNVTTVIPVSVLLNNPPQFTNHVKIYPRILKQSADTLHLDT